MTEILKVIKARDPNEKEFHQAVEEVVDSVKPVPVSYTHLTLPTICSV